MFVVIDEMSYSPEEQIQMRRPDDRRGDDVEKGISKMQLHYVVMGGARCH